MRCCVRVSSRETASARKSSTRRTSLLARISRRVASQRGSRWVGSSRCTPGQCAGLYSAAKSVPAAAVTSRPLATGPFPRQMPQCTARRLPDKPLGRRARARLPADGRHGERLAPIERPARGGADAPPTARAGLPTEQARTMVLQAAGALRDAGRRRDRRLRAGAHPHAALIKFRTRRDARTVAADAMELRCGCIEEWGGARDGSPCRRLDTPAGVLTNMLARHVDRQGPAGFTRRQWPPRRRRPRHRLSTAPRPTPGSSGRPGSRARPRAVACRR
jgi:hypothetical protein